MTLQAEQGKKSGETCFGSHERGGRAGEATNIYLQSILILTAIGHCVSPPRNQALGPRLGTGAGQSYGLNISTEFHRRCQLDQHNVIVEGF